MRILVLNHNARDRGTYHRAWPFARGLAGRGHDVVFCCVHPFRQYRAERRVEPVAGSGALVVHELPGWSGRQDRQEGMGPLDLVRRLRIAASRKFDIVWAFSHKRNCVAPARLARAIHGAPFVSDWCDAWGGPDGLFEAALVPSPAFQALPASVRAARRRQFRREAAWELDTRRRLADGVTVISRGLEDRALDLRIPSDRTRRILSGGNLEGVRPMDKNECRRRWGIEPGAVVAGYLANFHVDAGLLAGAARRMLAECPGLTLVLAGAPFEGTELETLPPAARPRLRRLGWVEPEAFPAFLGACDFFLLPMSDRRLNVERWPHKISDYLAAGRPVAANRVGDAAALILETGIGEVGPPTAAGLADAARRLIARREEWDDLGRRARRTAEERLDWGRAVGEAEDFLRSVLEMGRRRR